MTVFLYSRVSLDDQTAENQKLLAKGSGMTIDECFTDTGVSGGVKASLRPEFAKMVAAVKEGDHVVVSAVDRIGRDTIDVLSTVDMFQAKGVKVCVLAYGNLDLTSDMGRVVLTMAAAFAQLERAYLKTRTKQGMARTKAQGTKLGAPLKITPQNMQKMLEEKEGGASLEKIATKYGVARKTVARNLELWAGNLPQYQQEFQVRQAQYASSRM